MSLAKGSIAIHTLERFNWLELKTPLREFDESQLCLLKQKLSYNQMTQLTSRLESQKVQLELSITEMTAAMFHRHFNTEES